MQGGKRKRNQPKQKQTKKLPMDQVANTTTNGKVAKEPDEKRQRSEAKTVTKHILVVDLETSGDFIEVPKDSEMEPSWLISIGAVVLCVETNKVVSSARFSLLPEEGQGFEPKCWDQFWNKEDPPGSGERPLLKILEEFKAEAVHPKKAMQNFVDWVDEQERTYPTLVVWGDCLAFDYGIWLSTYIQRHLGLRSMLFNRRDKWRPIRCTESYGRALAHWTGGKSEEMWAKLERMIPDFPDKDLHCHDPVKDAEYIAKNAAAMLRYSARNPVDV